MRAAARYRCRKTPALRAVKVLSPVSRKCSSPRMRGWRAAWAQSVVGVAIERIARAPWRRATCAQVGRKAGSARYLAAISGPLPHGLPPMAQARPRTGTPHPTACAFHHRRAERGPPRPERVFLARGPGLLSLIGPICPAPSSGAATIVPLSRRLAKAPLERTRWWNCMGAFGDGDNLFHQSPPGLSRGSTSESAVCRTAQLDCRDEPGNDEENGSPKKLPMTTRMQQRPWRPRASSPPASRQKSTARRAQAWGWPAPVG